MSPWCLNPSNVFCLIWSKSQSPSHGPQGPTESALLSLRPFLLLLSPSPKLELQGLLTVPQTWKAGSASGSLLLLLPPSEMLLVPSPPSNISSSERRSQTTLSKTAATTISPPSYVPSLTLFFFPPDLKHDLLYILFIPYLLLALPPHTLECWVLQRQCV